MLKFWFYLLECLYIFFISTFVLSVIPVILHIVKFLCGSYIGITFLSGVLSIIVAFIMDDLYKKIKNGA